MNEELSITELKALVYDYSIAINKADSAMKIAMQPYQNIIQRQQVKIDELNELILIKIEREKNKIES